LDGFKDMNKVTMSAPPGAEPIDPSVKITAVTFGDVESRSDWSYLFALPPKWKSVDLSRRWRQFAHNVERLAA
jgi:hypothetical protein